MTHVTSCSHGLAAHANGHGGALVRWFDTCSILERGAHTKLAVQTANVYNGIESCPA